MQCKRTMSCGRKRKIYNCHKKLNCVLCVVVVRVSEVNEFIFLIFSPVCCFTLPSLTCSRTYHTGGVWMRRKNNIKVKHRTRDGGGGGKWKIYQIISQFSTLSMAVCFVHEFSLSDWFFRLKHWKRIFADFQTIVHASTIFWLTRICREKLKNKKNQIHEKLFQSINFLSS